MRMAPQRVEKPRLNRIRLCRGGGARGGSRPPRVESNAPEALLCKDSGERSEDFCAAVRRESNGIFEGRPLYADGSLCAYYQPCFARSAWMSRLMASTPTRTAEDTSWLSS